MKQIFVVACAMAFATCGGIAKGDSIKEGDKVKLVGEKIPAASDEKTVEDMVRFSDAEDLPAVMKLYSARRLIDLESGTEGIVTKTGSRWTAVRLTTGRRKGTEFFLSPKTIEVVASSPVVHATPEQAAAATGVFATIMAMGMLFVVVCGLSSLLIYLAPTFIALYRRHPNIAPIFLVNAFLGWSIFGWIAALAWSITALDQPERQRPRESARREDTPPPSPKDPSNPFSFD